MKIYRITKSYSYENGQYGGPVVWFHLFKWAAIRLAARLAEDFSGSLRRPSDERQADGVIVEFRHERNEHWIAVDAVPLKIFAPFSAVRRWLRQRMHWQNLNEHRGRTGSILKHGRAWAHRKSHYEAQQSPASLAWSWNFESKKWFGWSLELFDGDSYRDIGLSLHWGLAHFWFTFENIIPKKYAYPNHSWAHRTGLTLFDDHLSLQIHHAGNDCYDCKGWHGFSRSVFVRDALLGNAKHSEREIVTEAAAVPMPERTYPATVTISESTWTRSRWPFAKRLVRATIDVEGGVPVPGKGENSWDCGEDAIYSLTCPATTIPEAVSKMVESALRSRERYGGKNWRPSIAA